LWRHTIIKGYVTQNVFIPFYFTSSNSIASAARAVLLRISNIQSLCEVGSGSGYVTTELLKRFSNLYAIAIDAFSSATTITKLNAKKHMVFDRIDVVQCISGHCIREKSFDLVFSNPPYLPCPTILSPELCSNINENVYIDIALQLIRISKRFVILSSSSLSKAYKTLLKILKKVIVLGVRTPVDEVKILIIVLR